MRLTPLRDFVVLRLLPPHQNGGKLVVIATEKAVREGEVISVGPEVRDVSVGQRILVNRLAASQVGEFHLVSEKNILGTLP